MQSTQVASTLTDFPVYVALSDLGSDFHTNVKSDGSDIVVTSSNGTTKLSRELVAIDTTGNTGELHFKAPSLSSSADTDFYIYYGYAAATEINDTTTWNSNYLAVYHMQEDPSGTAPQMLDSTSNNRDLTSEGTMTSGDSVAGKLEGKALDFDGTDDRVNSATSILDPDSFDAGFTISLWAKPTSNNNNETIYDWPETASFGRVFSQFNSDGTLGYRFGSGDSSTSYAGISTYAANTWILLHAVHEGTSSNKLYKDGSNVHTDSTVLSLANNDSTYHAGDNAGSSSPMGGLIDEMRIMADAPTADWISSEGVNQTTPNTFYSVGTQETEPISKTFTATALLQDQDKSVTATFDTFLFQEIAKTFGADTLLEAHDTSKTFTFDARLINQFTKTLTFDTLLKGENSQNFTFDTLLEGQGVQAGFTADTLLEEHNKTKTFSFTALLQTPDNSDTFTADTLLQGAVSETFTADALLQRENSLNFQFDTILQGGVSKTFDFDAVLVLGERSKTFCFSSLLVTAQQKTDSETVLADFEQILDEKGQHLRLIKQTVTTDAMGRADSVSEVRHDILAVVQPINARDLARLGYGLAVSGLKKGYFKPTYTSGSDTIRVQEGDIIVDQFQTLWKVDSIERDEHDSYLPIYLKGILKNVGNEGSNNADVQCA